MQVDTLLLLLALLLLLLQLLLLLFLFTQLWASTQRYKVATNNHWCPQVKCVCNVAVVLLSC